MKRLVFQKSILSMLLCLPILGLTLVSCDNNDDFDDRYYETIQAGTYLKSQEKYSEFAALIDAAQMAETLNGEGGVFTCFVPNNKAMQNYYKENDLSLSQLSREKAAQLVRAHVIYGDKNSKPIDLINFPVGSISTPNMNDNYIRISVKGNDYSVLVNNVAKLTHWDFKVHNGIVHTIDHILETPLDEIKQELDKYPDFSIFTDALHITGLADSLYKSYNKDYTYIGPVSDGKASYPPNIMETPLACNYGYTVFMESNQTLANADIHTLEDLIQYSEDVYYKLFPLSGSLDEIQAIQEDYSHRENALNRFIAYHMMDRKQEINEFINPEWKEHFIPNTIIREYIEMMMPNSMIEIQSGNIINKSMTSTSSEQDIKILSQVAGTYNTLFHEISNLLTYEGVETHVFNKRLRIDVASFIPEFATNKLRGNLDAGYPYYVIPPLFTKNCKQLTYSDRTQLRYMGNKGWDNMYGDELIFVGDYDVTITTPAIPIGKWEIRMGYIPNYLRAITQVFINGKPVGTPIDFRIHPLNINNPKQAGSEVTDEEAILREGGYMRGPSSMVRRVDQRPLNKMPLYLRKILATEETTTTQPFTLRFKSTMENLQREFMLDFLEFVPSSYLNIEGDD